MTAINLDLPILLLAKKSFYEVYGLERKDPRLLSLMTADPETARELKEGHTENVEAIAAVETYLDRLGLTYVKSEGSQGKVDGRFGLVVAVGGDGTLLAASHQVLETRVVGINSRPGHSVGHFCVAEHTAFEPILDEILAGRRQATALPRMDVHINGFRKSPPVLNDILYTCRHPAAMTRYRISLDGREEGHRSSGIWVSTPAGSTGGIGAAGGQVMSYSERRLQFVVREPFVPKGTSYELQSGFFADGLAITNFSPEAAVYVDGTQSAFAIQYGDVIEPRVSEHPFHLFL